jgi:hypothetical protein
VIPKLRTRLKSSVSAQLEIIDTNPDRAAQRLKACGRLGFLLLDYAQSLPQDFAGVLVPTGAHEPLYQGCLMVGQHNIARRHEILPMKIYWQIMPMYQGTVND